MEQQHDTDQELPLRWHGLHSRYYRLPPGHNLKSKKTKMLTTGSNIRTRGLILVTTPHSHLIYTRYLAVPGRKVIHQSSA